MVHWDLVEQVASHTEAWIEIRDWASDTDRRDWVASHTEAWIEIAFSVPSSAFIVSRLPYGGVDWNEKRQNLYLHEYIVASHTEAWIEISYTRLTSDIGIKSPPIRRRGLKWFLAYRCFLCQIGRLPYGGVDWNIFKGFKVPLSERRLPYGGVDWNKGKIHKFALKIYFLYFEVI